MFGSRRGRPSLIGRAAQTAARTAVISATATTVVGKVAGRQAGSAAAAASAARQGPAAPAVGGLSDEALSRLQKLAELHAAGVLTAEEFAEQKARILA